MGWRAVIPSMGQMSRSVRRDPTPVPSRRLPHLFVAPPALAAIAVEDTVDHYRGTLDIGLPARREPVVEDDRPGDIFRQLTLDRPQNLLAACGVALHRLPLDHLVDLRDAIAVPVEARPATEKQVEDW